VKRKVLYLQQYWALYHHSCTFSRAKQRHGDEPQRARATTSRPWLMSDSGSCRRLPCVIEYIWHRMCQPRRYFTCSSIIDETCGGSVFAGIVVRYIVYDIQSGFLGSSIISQQYWNRQSRRRRRILLRNMHRSRHRCLPPNRRSRTRTRVRARQQCASKAAPVSWL